MNGIDSDDKHVVIDWDGIEGTPFTKINIKSGPKKKDLSQLYLHRMTKQVFTTNPLQKVSIELTQEKL